MEARQDDMMVKPNDSTVGRERRHDGETRWWQVGQEDYGDGTRWLQARQFKCDADNGYQVGQEELDNWIKWQQAGRD
jgi:hypothetical protein